MKILLRSSYEWVDAIFNKENGKILNAETGNIIYPYQIVSIEDDERTKYVMCKGCGEIILNTPEVIYEHQHKCESSKACLTCKTMRQDVKESLDSEYILNEDGTYTVMIKNKAQLLCGNSYWHPADINSKDAREMCKYVKCKTKGVHHFDDFFITYPGAFDKIATVDVLNPKKWEYKSHIYGDNGFYYQAKKRFRLYAQITNTGIISEFEYEYRGRSYRFVYSPKYNQIFWFENGDYTNKNIYYLTEKRLQELRDTVAEIYTKETTK